MTDQTTPAGWYPAPSEPGLQRYWDGQGWGDDRRPASPDAAPLRALSGLTIAGFVIAIISMLLAFLGGGVIPGILAWVLAANGRHRDRSSLGKAAIIIAVIAIIVSVLVAISRVTSNPY